VTADTLLLLLDYDDMGSWQQWNYESSGRVSEVECILTAEGSRWQCNFKNNETVTTTGL
jgi:hypothetical protein